MNRSISFYIVYIVLIPVMIIIGDQFFKFSIPVLKGVGSFGPLVFGEVFNHGFMMGGLASLPPSIRIICASTLLGFAFFLFLLIQYLLTPNLIVLRLGLSFVVGGIAGNVIDRALFGYVRDFISLMNGIYFNVADFFLGPGVLLCIYSFFAFRNVLWHPDCIRKGVLINPRLQFAFSFKLTLIAFAFCLVLASFSLAFMKSIDIPSEHLRVYILSLVALSGVFLVLTFIAGLFLSHRSIGPLYGFEQFVEGLLSGTNQAPFRLREGDNYKHLEQIAEKIRQRLKL